MERTSVDSSMIKSIGQEGNTVQIEFTNGKIFEYYDVPAGFASNLINSGSIGKEFHKSKHHLANFKEI